MCLRFTKTLWPGMSPNPRTTLSRAMSMGAERRSRITGWRTRATRPPPAVQLSRATPPSVSVARFFRREDVEFLGRKPETGGLLPFRGSSSCVNSGSYGLGFRQTSLKTPRVAVRAVFRASEGHGHAPGWRSVEDHVGRVVGHDGATLGRGPRDGVRGWSTSPPAALVADRKRGVRGGAAPHQPPQGTHGVWPHGVSLLACLLACLLVSHNHADTRLICMTGSTGTVVGSIGWQAVRGRASVWSPPSFPMS